ncbi:hypothetical protein OG562_40450 [Streptomyces sp. NBC_01275]|uniref:hypothetical protein n=1 Tax=Streptomyces sp. NBC_01275 TaxID=2903807 RepID=UPI0022510114|nr:hypothetical protein [Streptomyces sp. NBC_01275]MCX4767135.1 hypothetical protein [Streptomyces sp. NBC_01275]
MHISSTAPPSTPATVWQTRGRHTGPAAPDVLRKNLQALKESGALQDFLELPESETAAGETAFEARWQVPEEVTVRARLTLAEWSGRGQEWTLVAEAEQPWDLRWPSPAALFWPWEAGADAPWGHETVTGLRFLDVNPLPTDEKELRRTLRDALRDTWTVHIVVHEAMTPDERGRRTLVPLLPPGLHHRVIEHRAAPHQLRTLNWALRESGVEVPRGGALVLPGIPAPDAYDAADFSVRSVFLDGTHPTELLDAVKRFVALPKPPPEGADAALTVLREQWLLLTLEEELDQERRLVARYKEALEAMTQSRDLYREAAEHAHEALEAFREAAAEAGEAGQPRQPQTRPGGSPFQQLGRTLERLRDTAKGLRPAPTATAASAAASTSAPTSASPSTSPSTADHSPERDVTTGDGPETTGR